MTHTDTDRGESGYVGKKKRISKKTERWEVNTQRRSLTLWRSLYYSGSVTSGDSSVPAAWLSWWLQSAESGTLALWNTPRLSGVHLLTSRFCLQIFWVTSWSNNTISALLLFVTIQVDWSELVSELWLSHTRTFLLHKHRPGWRGSPIITMPTKNHCYYGAADYHCQHSCGSRPQERTWIFYLQF